MHSSPKRSSQAQQPGQQLAEEPPHTTTGRNRSQQHIEKVTEQHGVPPD